MPEKDENAPKGTQEAEERKRTRDVRIPPVGEAETPAEEEVPDVEPRRIHPRRPLPLVPPKRDDPGSDPDKSKDH